MTNVNQRGFTLMELIVTMVIIGVLTAIAIPNYTAYIQRSNRAEARNQLLEAATWMERYRTERGRYDNPAAVGTQTLPMLLQCVPRNTTGAGTCRDYDVRFQPAGTVTSIAYEIRAVPVPGGRMAADVCGELWLNETAERRFTGGTGSQDVCWNR